MRWKFFVVEAFRSLRSNVATTVAAVVTVLIVMFLAGVGLALGSYVYNYSNEVREDVVIKSYLRDDATAKQVGAIQKKAKDDPRVASVAYVSKEEARERMERQLGPQAEILKLTLGNPLPASIEVKARNPDDTAAIAASLKGMKGLQAATKALPNPDYGSKKADRVLETAGTVTAIIAGMGVILAVAAVLLIGNTIRLSIFARRREVEVMKLVGATNWFVRWPFMLEGMLCGLMGAAAAVALLFFSSSLLRDRFESLSTGETSAIGFPVLVVALLGAGLALGAVGSGITMRRFLRV